jgi:hypothetical protein
MYARSMYAQPGSDGHADGPIGTAERVRAEDGRIGSLAGAWQIRKSFQ